MRRIADMDRATTDPSLRKPGALREREMQVLREGEKTRGRGAEREEGRVRVCVPV